FAFMRALVQGVDERLSWEKYLRHEGEHSDIRTVRRTIAWIRDAFAAAAQREARPGTARLIRLDAARFNDAGQVSRPSLEDFAEAQGLTDFSEAEQIEAYEAAYPQANDAKPAVSRRRRVIERQLEALRWLEELAAQDPKPGDGVGAWFSPVIAERLERAGIPTLFTLAERVNGLGARWWFHVQGIGAGKAVRLVDWLRANEQVLGMSIGEHAFLARRQTAQSVLATVVSRGTSLVPFEKLVVPADLDGRTGRYRAPQAQCLLMASNDYEAIGAWISAKGEAGPGDALSATQRAYRKEAERLILWAVLERLKPMSSLTVEDAIAYREFLAAPPSTWCGPRHYQRWSPMWRPLEGPISPGGQRQALTILKSLFDFLISQGYLTGNPFAAVAKPRQPGRPLGSNRTFTIQQWDYMEKLLDERAVNEPARRLRRAMRLIYATGLRLDEVTRVSVDELYSLGYESEQGSAGQGWMLAVTGKGGRTRDVPVPEFIVEDLQDELERNGYERGIKAVSNAGLKLLARFDPKLPAPAPWAASSLYKAIVNFVQVAAEGVEGPDAERLKRATTHWLRHSHASHALQGRGGRPGVPIQVVQNNLGHASVGTTSGYLTTEREERIRAMLGFWGA
ncbi:MAG: phage integrase family protein, partial [Burkholderiaceae bacterium]|nr:phage integrase family protein [Burkholderiaceae bacterium]